jgi:hypothetical protein
MAATMFVEAGEVYASRFAVVLFACTLGVACARDEKLSSLCSQEIPRSQQFLFEFTIAGDWAFTSDPRGYTIKDAPAKVRRGDKDELPEGRLIKITGDGTVHIARIIPEDPKVREETIRHVIRGVPVVETIYYSNGAAWSRGKDYVFDGVQAAGDRIAFTRVRDDSGTLNLGRVEVDAGGIVAQETNGVLQSLTLYRIEPDPSRSPPGVKRRFIYETYSPAPGHSIRLEELPPRGICKKAS